MAVTDARPELSADAAYASLEERVLARDQVGASSTFYDLVQARRPVAEMVREMVRIHAPYTHVPYHQRLDDGLVKFVNNDHCLLSIRASTRLMPLVSADLQFLPLAQSIWYIPTGLDPWNQLLGNAPGHYARMYEVTTGVPSAPQVHWPDQAPVHLNVDSQEALNEWLTLVQRGEVLPAYRVFLGLLEDVENRQRLLAQLAFAGLIDVQDRMLFNRSYTTGHKSYRARATIELGNLVGWDNAHSIVYAGVPDMAVGPRWYSTYEMASNVVLEAFEGNDHDLLAQRDGLSRSDVDALFDVLLQAQEPVWTHFVTALLKAGKGVREILDVIQVVAAENILRTHDPKGFSMPQHAYEYCNTVRWFLDNFDHPHQVKLLYVAAAFVNRAAHHQANTPGNGPYDDHVPASYQALSSQELLRRIEDAILELRADDSVVLTRAYLNGSAPRRPLVEVMANACSKLGNDPHNQELGLCLVEDYRHSTAADRERLLLAAAKHSAGHRKYGDPLEAYQRFIAAVPA
jgi:hypothetical protein